MDLMAVGYFWVEAPGLQTALDMTLAGDEHEAGRVQMLAHLRTERRQINELFMAMGWYPMCPQVLMDTILKQMEVNSDILYLTDSCYYELLWLNGEIGL